MIVRKASAFESQHSLQIATQLAELDCRFVCVPTFDHEDHYRMTLLCANRLDVVIAGANLDGDLVDGGPENHIDGPGVDSGAI